MRVINHNWSATKQRPHPQSVAEISRHSVLSEGRIQQCETLSGSRHKDILVYYTEINRKFIRKNEQKYKYMYSHVT